MHYEAFMCHENIVRDASGPDVDAVPPERLPEQLDHVRCGVLTETQRHLSLLRSYLAVRVVLLFKLKIDLRHDSCCVFSACFGIVKSLMK